MLGEGSRFFCSWSGGKDSCLALHRIVQAGAGPGVLLTMLTEEGVRSRSHGLPVPLLMEQAACIGMPIVFRAASWKSYEDAFLEAVKDFKAKGVEHGVFGDIDLEPHRAWVERVCTAAGVEACEPLWKSERRGLLEEFIGGGYDATLVAVKDGVLDRTLLGRRLDMSLVDELVAAGVDASGEKGEYHTVVTDGPIFQRPLRIVKRESVLRDGYWFLDVTLQNGLARNGCARAERTGRRG